MVLVQSSFHTAWASPFEMELEPNSLDWNGIELECKLELEDMKHTNVCIAVDKKQYVENQIQKKTTIGLLF